MTAADFRRIALSLPGTLEASHMGQPDFRVGGRIFATLAAEAQGYGNLKLSRELQAEFIVERPDLFMPIAGGRGRGGMTYILLVKATEDEAAGALLAAWRLRVVASEASRGPARRTKKSRS